MQCELMFIHVPLLFEIEGPKAGYKLHPAPFSRGICGAENFSRGFETP